jgi:hypothetical protein
MIAKHPLAVPQGFSGQPHPIGLPFVKPPSQQNKPLDPSLYQNNRPCLQDILAQNQKNILC